MAIALVIAAGVGTMVMAAGLIASLTATRQAYYDRYRFADLFAPLVRAPEPVMDRVRRIDGVATAESRVSTRASLDVPGVAEPAAAHVHSLPSDRRSALNRLVLRAGRFPEPGRADEAVANEAFIKGARIPLGSRLKMVLHGKQVEMRIVGSVLSPEYIYALSPGSVFPDDRRSGVLWMAREPLAAALDMKQAFNDVLVKLAPGANPAEVERRLDLILAPYGAIGAYPRALQLSDRFVTDEIAQLTTMATLLPPVFLLVAAFLLNIVLARLVDTEREVIGLLKAFGFPTRAILLHYVALALLLSALGFVLGIGLGNWLGHSMATLYQRFFAFPFLTFRTGPGVYLGAAAATLVPVLLGAATAVWRSARLEPAAAMRPEAPADYSGRLSTLLAGALGRDEPSRIIMRGLIRRPVRSLLTVTGLAAALMLYVASQSPLGSVERMIDLGFNIADRSDLVVTFAEPRDARALHELERIPGVIEVQPFRAVAARLRAGRHEVREGISGAEPNGRLQRAVDLSGLSLDAPPHGAILTEHMARDLGVGIGDRVDAVVTEGERPVLSLPVTAVLDSPFGSAATLERSALNRLLREGDTLSGAFLMVDDAALPAIYARLKASPMVAGITVRAATLRTMEEIIQGNFRIQTFFYTALAVLVVIGVVYNSARISLSERARDLASLRVLGFRRSEVAFVLLGEQAVLLLLALPLGIWWGRELWRYLISQFNTDRITIPFHVDPAVPAMGVLVVAAAAAGTALLIRLRVDRLDLVRALKTRE